MDPVPDPPPAPGPSGLDPAATERAMRLVMIDGLAVHTMTTLAGGVFLTAYALALGASNTVIGLMAALPFLGQLSQVPGILLVERLRRRRLITMIFAGAGRAGLLVSAAACLVPPGVGLWMVVGGLAWWCFVAAVSGCSWNSWMRDLVPETRLGGFFGRRLFGMTAAGAVLGYAAAQALDLWKRIWPAGEVYGYGVAFLLAAVAAAVSLWLLSRTPEPAMPPPDRGQPLATLFAAPFRDRNFRRLMVFLAAWGFAANLAAPFFTVYMLTTLGMGMADVVPLTVVSQAVNLVFLRIFGSLSDRFSNRSVLAVCLPVFLVCLIGWTFATFPEPHRWTLPLLYGLHAGMGLATAGVMLASGNIALKLSPKGKATAYLAMNGMISSLAAGIAPIVGGVLADVFASRELSLAVHWTSPASDVEFAALELHHWDFLFALAAVIGLYALHRLTMVREHGTVRSKVLLREMMLTARRAVYTGSTVAGLRVISALPLAGLVSRKRRE